jgi:hypothetical protein
MTVELPNIILKLNTEKKLISTNTNTNESKSTTENTINNNIILNDLIKKSSLSEGLVKSASTDDLAKSSALSVQPAKISKTPSYSTIQNVKSPALVDNVLRFKDQFAAFLIEYFKSDIVLLNNVLEVSDKIVFKIDDLKILISILLEIEPTAIQVEYEDILKNVGCCGKICKRIPLFKKITDIIINNRQSFLITYNTIAVQLQTEFNISLSYIIL